MNMLAPDVSEAPPGMRTGPPRSPCHRLRSSRLIAAYECQDKANGDDDDYSSDERNQPGIVVAATIQLMSICIDFGEIPRTNRSQVPSEATAPKRAAGS